MLKVVKFGGSSVANATQIKKIKSIIESDSSRRIIVTSALGKGKNQESKVTDLLFLLYAHLEYGVDYINTFNTVKERFLKLKNDLNLNYDIESEFDKLNTEVNSRTQKDYLISRGEYFTAILIAEYLGYDFVDAKDLISLNYDGTVNYELTQKNTLKVLETKGKIVIPGYYAKAPNGLIRLFSRGGSDLTGSIITKVLEADEYENWTDVSGIYVADPKIVKDPDRIKNITYDELRELSYRGAQVLHQESVIPLKKLGIPIHIKNTNNPEDYGTKIANTHDDHKNIVTGIAGNKNYTSFNITKNSARPIVNVLKDVLNLFIRYKLNIEHIPTGIDTFSVIIKTKDIKDLYFDLINEIRNVEGIINLALEDDISLIAIVGRKMSHIPGVAGKIFTCLGKNKINVKIIAQASTEISIILGVSNNDYNEAIRLIYREFND